MKTNLNKAKLKPSWHSSPAHHTFWQVVLPGCHWPKQPSALFFRQDHPGGCGSSPSERTLHPGDPRVPQQLQQCPECSLCHGAGGCAQSGWVNTDLWDAWGLFLLLIGKKTVENNLECHHNHGVQPNAPGYLEICTLDTQNPCEEWWLSTGANYLFLK